MGPHLGDAGGVPPWDLTDAIDNRDPAKALRALHRLLRDRVPIVVLASIHNHVERLFRLALLGIRDEKLAAVELGVKGSTYPVKKALSMLPRWGDTTAAMQLSHRVDGWRRRHRGGRGLRRPGRCRGWRGPRPVAALRGDGLVGFGGLRGEAGVVDVPRGGMLGLLQAGI